MSLIGNLGPILSGFTMASGNILSYIYTHTYIYDMLMHLCAVGKFVSDRVKDDERAFEVSLKVLTVFMTIAG